MTEKTIKLTVADRIGYLEPCGEALDWCGGRRWASEPDNRKETVMSPYDNYEPDEYEDESECDDDDYDDDDDDDDYDDEDYDDDDDY